METPAVQPPMKTDEITLVEKRHEHGDVYTLVFRSDAPIAYQAGQYVHMRLADIPPPEKSVREFSFASAPSDADIAFAINTGSGSVFQKALLALEPGATVTLFKIKGHMTVKEESGAHLVFIGQGVGVAPFRSILRDIAARKLPVTTTLIQVGRPPFLYEGELAELATEHQLTGREFFDQALRDAVKQHPLATYYIAGAPQFVDTTLKRLVDAGIPRESIQTDPFKGLGEEA